MKNFILITCILVICNHPITSQAQSLRANEIKLSLEADDDEIILRWNTQKEINTRYFIVERSSDGIHFYMISSVKTRGSSMFPCYYEFHDYEKSDTVASYRIVLVNMDGVPNVSAVISNCKNKVDMIAEMK